MSTCEVNECSDSVHARGHCKYHYYQLVKGYTPGPRTRVRNGEFSECQFEGCDRPHRSKGWCGGHYAQVAAGNEPKPLRKLAPRGSGSLNGNGYRMIAVDGSYVPEHRYIYEQFLGRKLLKEENIHHKNGVRHDNRLENLELWSSSQPSGQRVEDKIAWAKELLSLYEGYGTITT